MRHSGTYIDPHTNRPREFDLQVHLPGGDEQEDRILLAIECKNLSEYAPIVVSRSVRSTDEAYYKIIALISDDADSLEPGASRFRPWMSLDIPAKTSPFPLGEYTGKSIDQVQRKGDGKLVSNAAEIYDRWSQAVNSAASMIPDLQGTENYQIEFIALVPILVVPDDRLFVADFDDKGAQQGTVKEARSVDYFIDYTPGAGPRGFQMSHLRIVTESALDTLIDELRKPMSPLSESFLSSQRCNSALVRSIRLCRAAEAHLRPSQG